MGGDPDSQHETRNVARAAFKMGPLPSNSGDKSAILIMLCPLQSAELTDRNIGLPCTLAFTDVYLTCSQDCRIFNLCIRSVSSDPTHKGTDSTSCVPTEIKDNTKEDYVSQTQKGTVSTLCQCVHIEIKDSSKDSLLFLFLVSTKFCSFCNWTHRRRTHRSRNTQWLGTIREHSVPCSVAWNGQETLSALLSGLERSGNTQCPAQ